MKEEPRLPSARGPDAIDDPAIPVLTERIFLPARERDGTPAAASSPAPDGKRKEEPAPAAAEDASQADARLDLLAASVDAGDAASMTRAADAPEVVRVVIEAETVRAESRIANDVEPGTLPRAQAISVLGDSLEAEPEAGGARREGAATAAVTGQDAALGDDLGRDGEPAADFIAEQSQAVPHDERTQAAETSLARSAEVPTEQSPASAAFGGGSATTAAPTDEDQQMVAQAEALRTAVLQRVAERLPAQIDATVRELMQPAIDRAMVRIAEEAQVALRISLQEIVEQVLREELARHPDPTPRH
jgi:hypothetical protein